MDFGTYVAETGDIRLLMFGTPGQRRFWFMTDILKGDVDVVIYVIDAEATHTHAEAGEAMRTLLKDLRVPLVVAVNRCNDPAAADLVARRLGSLQREMAVPCQLIHTDSGPRRRRRGPAGSARSTGTSGWRVRDPLDRLLDAAGAQ